jgi:hypothetical protein
MTDKSDQARLSRKGAMTQRKDYQKKTGVRFHLVFIATFAALREIYFAFA